MDHGVRIFRVDNPHTKPVAFWEWLIAEVRATDPDVLFLAEAFTRPAMMHTLAKVGFHQSYTYFTWRNEQVGARGVPHRAVAARPPHFLRPNFFVNTPDILHAYLQYGGPPAFKIRAVLAATLSPTWGVYAGFELFEHVAVRPGSEEYLDSEKYQLPPARLGGGRGRGPHAWRRYLTRLNEIRRAHPALQQLRNLRFHHTDNDQVIALLQAHGRRATTSCSSSSTSTRTRARETTVLARHAGTRPGLGRHRSRCTTSSPARPTAGARHNYVRLDPCVEPGARPRPSGRP